MGPDRDQTRPLYGRRVSFPPSDPIWLLPAASRRISIMFFLFSQLVFFFVENCSSTILSVLIVDLQLIFVHRQRFCPFFDHFIHITFVPALFL